MRIHNIQSKTTDNEKVISGFLDDFELWYRIPASYGSDASAINSYTYLPIVVHARRDISEPKAKLISRELAH